MALTLTLKETEKILEEMGFDSGLRQLLRDRVDFISQPSKYAAIVFLLKNGAKEQYIGEQVSLIVEQTDIKRIPPPRPGENDTEIFKTKEIVYANYTITQSTIYEVQSLYGADEILDKKLENTPLGQNKFFTDISDCVGTTLTNSVSRMLPNHSGLESSGKHIVGGRLKYSCRSGPIGEFLSMTVQPFLHSAIEQYSLFVKKYVVGGFPGQVMGSIQHCAAWLNGMIGSIQNVVTALYRGVERIIRYFYSVINGILQYIQILLMTFIEMIIPLSLINDILSLCNAILGEIGMIASFFPGTDKFLSALNAIRYNPVQAWLTNPVGMLTEKFLGETLAKIDKQLQKLLNVAQKMQVDVRGFFGSLLDNHGYTFLADVVRTDLVTALRNSHPMVNGAFALMNYLGSGSYLGGSYPRPIQYHYEPYRNGPVVLPMTIHSLHIPVDRFGNRYRPLQINEKCYEPVYYPYPHY